MPLIVIEGIDKAGKDTQSKLLSESLRRKGQAVNTISFPDYSTPIGREIERFLTGRVDFRPEVRQLLYVANRWEREADMTRWLRQGTFLIADRYVQAGLVYGMANGLDLDWMLGLEKGLPQADLVIVIDVSPEVAAARERGRDIYENDLDFQRRIRSIYLELGERLGWKKVNGDRPPQDVAQEIFELIKTTIESG